MVILATLPLKPVTRKTSTYRLREGYKDERTALINRIRGVLAEFGLVFPRSAEAPRRVLADALEDAGKRTDRISQWLVQLKDRVGWQKAVVALAKKNARILWAVLTREGTFDANHVREAPVPHRAFDSNRRPRGEPL